MLNLSCKPRTCLIDLTKGHKIFFCCLGGNLIQRFFLCLILVIGFSGCQTRGFLLRETPLGLSETRRAIASVIGVPKSVSSNGRELISFPHDRIGRRLDDNSQVTDRNFTHIIILGDRRPYDIQVQVFVEKKKSENGRFEVTDQDLGLSEKVAKRIKEALYQSHNNRNIIDDFRPL